MLIKDLTPFMQGLSQVCQKQTSERKTLLAPGVINVTITHLKGFTPEVKREIRFAEKEYVCSELFKCKGNTNSIWKIINRCLPNREPSLTAVEDPVVQANSFNDFYISVGEAAAARARALCEQYGFSEESVRQYLRNVVEMSVTVNNNSPAEDYVHPDDHTQPTDEMTPGFKPFTV
ncbi:unnamed protein product [Porites lobata]|uniref:Uncharacterized protein n=1 Tax=Porites lobata TaxID=104759 RepID=A0ABN8QQ81_9CNID|nr:unnamed protein product [Porites lobata]